MSTSETLTLKDPERLYLDWEHAHWASQDIDLSRDPADWDGLEEGERNLLYFALSSLMVAEERISTQFCGLVLAQDDEEEGSTSPPSWWTRSATCSSTRVFRTR